MLIFMELANACSYFYENFNFTHSTVGHQVKIDIYCSNWHPKRLTGNREGNLVT